MRFPLPAPPPLDACDADVGDRIPALLSAADSVTAVVVDAATDDGTTGGGTERPAGVDDTALLPSRLRRDSVGTVDSDADPVDDDVDGCFVRRFMRGGDGLA